MSSQKFMKGVMEKNLKVKKAPLVQGSVKIHFPNKKIDDIVLTNSDPVDLFKWIGVTVDDLKRSNLQELVMRGDVVIL